MPVWAIPSPPISPSPHILTHLLERLNMEELNALMSERLDGGPGFLPMWCID